MENMALIVMTDGMLRRIEIGDPRLSSDITGILMGTDVPPRRDFIYEHAQDAELDV